MAASPEAAQSLESLRQSLSSLIPAYLTSINYTRPVKVNKTSLREALLEQGRRHGVVLESDDASLMLFETGLAVAADMYPLHPREIQTHIGLFTWLGCIIDDRNADIGPDLELFQSRFHSGEEQPRAFVECFASVLRATGKYYDPVVANLIVVSALTFVNFNALELRP